MKGRRKLQAEWKVIHLPRPRMPLAPLARQSKRSFSMESVVVCMALWALLIISASCLVDALCGLFQNIPEMESWLTAVTQKKKQQTQGPFRLRKHQLTEKLLAQLGSQYP